jgi:hypothetical protein
MTSTPDLNYKSYADLQNLAVCDEIFAPINPENYDDIFKLSNVQDAIVSNCIINPHGGNREDGVDMMRYCERIKMADCQVGAGKKYAFTIKGGCNDIVLENIVITRHGGGWERVDIDIGNYSGTVPDARTGRVILRELHASDGKPVRVRVGWAKEVIVEGGNVEMLRCQSLGLKVYVQVMRGFA